MHAAAPRHAAVVAPAMVSYHACHALAGAATALPPAIAVADYDWSTERPSKAWRTIAIWAFVLELRTRLFLVDQKWAFPGGFTPQK